MRTMNLPDNQEDREVYLRECGAGDFVDALKERQQTGAVLVQALNPAWTTDAIYVAVEYIREEGVAVTLAIQDWGEGPEVALRALREGGEALATTRPRSLIASRAMLDWRLRPAQYGDMSKSSRLQERYERQAAELLAIIQRMPRITTAELAYRTGMSHGVVIKRLAILQDEGKVIRNRDLAKSVSATARGLSLDERISTIERLLDRDLA